MEIAILLTIVLLVSFLLLFIFIYRGEKDKLKKGEANLFHVIITAFILAVIPTAVIALFIFILFGSTNVVNSIFSLQLSKNQLIIIAISFFIYLFFIDGLIETILKVVVGKNSYQYTLPLIHIFIFYVIGLILDLQQRSSMIIALGVAVILFLIQVLYDKVASEE